ncbi:class I SAM-dependent methyltransferase [Clostridium sp. CF012]|uniref:class I SAM-dependent methyltransferase n=1 Tax=Clostridium sp. CF012 TaxID=2843319 RepID=UPI001C0D4AA6|nr:class I SAM-dependent methyltransferase [Clostridium sp. CF012]MBU3143815.1 methyltransferase domain-containing protein [Clostridium sp. CF012]
MNLEELNPKKRFSSRTNNYAKYRPGYPNEIISYLIEFTGLSKTSVIADIGSGTGICTKTFLDNGNTVYAVEPNEDMRQVAEHLLETYDNFHSIDGSSENTKLKSESVDIIIAAQAFHWFDPKPTKEEFLKILRPNGVVVLLWNIRNVKSDGFMQEYLELIERYGENYTSESNGDIMPKFFDYRTIHKKVFNNPQLADFDRLKGELASFSYIPNESNPNFQPMISELQDLFDKYNSNNGNVVLEYETHLYYCKIK